MPVMGRVTHFARFLGHWRSCRRRVVGGTSLAHRLITCPVGNEDTAEGEDNDDEEGEEEEPVDRLFNTKIPCRMTGLGGKRTIGGLQMRSRHLGSH